MAKPFFNFFFVKKFEFGRNFLMAKNYGIALIETKISLNYNHLPILYDGF